MTTKIVASRYGGGGTRIKNYWKFSRIDKPRLDQRTTGSKKTFENIKSFSVARKYY